MHLSDASKVAYLMSLMWRRFSLSNYILPNPTNCPILDCRGILLRVEGAAYEIITVVWEITDPANLLCALTNTILATARIALYFFPLKPYLTFWLMAQERHILRSYRAMIISVVYYVRWG